MKILFKYHFKQLTASLAFKNHRVGDVYSLRRRYESVWLILSDVNLRACIALAQKVDSISPAPAQKVDLIRLARAQKVDLIHPYHAYYLRMHPYAKSRQARYTSFHSSLVFTTVSRYSCQTSLSWTGSFTTAPMIPAARSAALSVPSPK